MDSLLLEVTDFFINENYDRIKSGERLNVDNIPYTTKDLDEMIVYFEEHEDYEKCSIILTYKNDILDHDKHFKNQ